MVAPKKKSSSNSKREVLMSAIKNENVDELISITKSASGSELSDALAELSKAQLEDFWRGMYSFYTTTLMSCDKDVEDEEFTEKMGLILKATTDLAHGTLKAVLAEKGDTMDKTPIKVCESFLETVILLHGMLPNLEEGLSALKNQMSRLFEEWWTNKIEGRHEIAVNAMLYLLSRSTQPKAFQQDVSRVWAMRDVLKCINLQDNSGSTFTSLLQQCVHHPQFISTNHGVRFLAFILTLHPELTEKLHQSIKAVLFTTPRSWHSKYGEIYFRSWQGANDEMKLIIQESCIQDLMFRAVHACRKGPHCASAALFQVMSYIHKQKTQRGVESMLANLYAPILWRSLKVPNSDVRLNAASLMFNVFPLQDPTLQKEDADTALQEQFYIMNTLLSDPIPEIRVTAVLGIGRVLGMYWELIPVQVIQDLVTVLVQDLLYDSSSPAVREAVLKVMYQLCDNHLCIPMLKKVLPELGNFIHDNSERVRVAVLDLLLKVKGLRAIKYWSIVPIEHILTRLETDSQFVVRRIMSLISSSFAPINNPPHQQVERCLSLIDSNREAARQFFLNLPNSLGIVDTVKYILVLCRYALESTRLWTKSSTTSGHLQSEDTNEDNSDVGVNVSRRGRTKAGGKKRKPQSKRGRNKDSVVDENEEDEENSSVERSGGEGSEAAFSMELLSGMIEGVYLMFTSIVSQLSASEHTVMKEGLMKKLIVTVRELIRVSQDPLLEQALIGLAGHLPSRALPTVSQNLLNKLKDRSMVNSSPSVDVNVIVKVLVQWGRADDMLEMVQESFLAFLKRNVADTPMKGNKHSPKGRKKVVVFDTEESCINVEKAREIMVSMVTHAECRPIMMNKHNKCLTSFVKSLEKAVMKKLEEQLKVLATEADHKRDTREKKRISLNGMNADLTILLSIFTSYLRLVVFLCLKSTNQKEGEDGNSDSTDCDRNEVGHSLLKSCLMWIRKSILPQLQVSPDKLNSHSYQIAAVSEMVMTAVKACSSLSMIGINDWSILDSAGEICLAILKLPTSPQTNNLLHVVLVFTYHSAQMRGTKTDSENPEGCEPMEEQEMVSDSFSTCSLSKFPLQFSVIILESAFKIMTSSREEVDSESLNKTKNATDSTLISFSTLYSSLGELYLALMKPGIDMEVFEKTMETVTMLVIGDCRRMSQLDKIGPDNDTGKAPWPHQPMLTFIKKSPKALSYFTDETISHLSSDKVDIHSLHGIVYMADSIKTKSSDPINPALKEAVNSCLTSVSPGDMDEDVFRDVKSQVQQKVITWTRPR